MGGRTMPSQSGSGFSRAVTAPLDRDTGTHNADGYDPPHRRLVSIRRKFFLHRHFVQNAKKHATSWQIQSFADGRYAKTRNRARRSRLHAERSCFQTIARNNSIAAFTAAISARPQWPIRGSSRFSLRFDDVTIRLTPESSFTWDMATLDAQAFGGRLGGTPGYLVAAGLITSRKRGT